MIIIDDFVTEYTGIYRTTYNLNHDALGLRLHAFCNNGYCPNISDAQAWIAFHLRHNQQWLSEGELADVKNCDNLTDLHHCNKSFLIYDLYNLLDKEQSIGTVKRMISEMELPDTTDKVETWTAKIADFAQLVASLAWVKNSEKLTMVIEFREAKAGTVEEPMVVVDEDCAVCLEGLDNGHVVTLPCKHKFHLTCFTRWLDVRMQCPYCRSETIV